MYDYYFRPLAHGRARQRAYCWCLQNLGVWNHVFGKIPVNGQFQRHLYFRSLKTCVIGVQVSKEQFCEIMKGKLLGCACISELELVNQDWRSKQKLISGKIAMEMRRNIYIYIYSDDLKLVSKHNAKIIEIPCSAHVSKRTFLLHS
jgi:hypothetical protein